MLDTTFIPQNKRLVMCDTGQSSYVTPDQVEQIDANTNPTQRGSRHNPASFTTFINQIVGSLEEFGWSIKEHCLVLGHEGNRLFMGFTVHDRWSDYQPDYYTTVLGARACYDSMFAREVNGGDMNFICDNLLMSGQLAINKTKQTTFIGDRQLKMVVDAVKELRAYAQRKADFYTNLTDTRTSDDEAHALFSQVYLDGGFTSNQLTTAIDVYHKPIHTIDDGPEQRGTAWGAWNACSHALKGTNQILHTNRCRVLEDTTKKFFGWV